MEDGGGTQHEDLAGFTTWGLRIAETFPNSAGDRKSLLNFEVTCANLCKSNQIYALNTSFQNMLILLIWFMGNLTRNLTTSYHRNLPRCCPETNRNDSCVASPSCPIFRFSPGRAAARALEILKWGAVNLVVLQSTASFSTEGMEDLVSWKVYVMADLGLDLANRSGLRLDTSWYFKA